MTLFDPQKKISNEFMNQPYKTYPITKDFDPSCSRWLTDADRKKMEKELKKLLP